MTTTTSEAVFLWISGQSGAGKTTLGTNLSDHYGFVHFDGDVFYQGGDPIADAGIYKQHTDRPEELKQKWSLVSENFGALFTGALVPVEDWADSMECLVQAVAQAVSKQPNPIRFAVSFAVYPRSVRQWIEERLLSLTGKQIQFVVLYDAEKAAPRRKLEQTKEVAKSQGKSLEEFWKSHGKPDGSEEAVLRELSMVQRGFEPGVEEQGEMAIRIVAAHDTNTVLDSVVQRLGLKKKQSS